MRATIIGGGIGGLALALALLRNGWEVEVRERSADLPSGGTGLGMWPEAMAALDSLGVGDAVRKQSVHCAGGALLRADGTIIAGLGAERSAHLVARNTLLRTLYAALPPEAVRWNSPYSPEQGFPGGDLLVGADGIHSSVRSAVLPGVGPRKLGTTAFRGVIAGRVGTVSETWTRGGLFGITPAGGNGINWFAALRSELVPAGDHLDSAGFLRRFFDGAHPAVRAVVDTLTPDRIDRRTLLDVQLTGSYVSGRTVLIGDAAHAMAPNLGRGACETLLDAVALADALAGSQDLDSGLRQFDRVRRPVGRRMVRLARVLNRAATAKHLLPVRNGLVSAAARFGA
ncbi:FAD-dependent monooxygenase [Arthrobacter sp. Sa2BUA2]|uniref:FAD-dependent monooxygenase n=1 Tax=Arthrobacter pullicola TaxID=2762224 RepID=A0ABR8YKM4_9MICC|nr:FAD-dependent monooxygenase [Arthrobacter pullicola]MBD8044778.1 FAD-dependent monooxygenase [Arthrobacter pullicola]